MLAHTSAAVAAVATSGTAPLTSVASMASMATLARADLQAALEQLASWLIAGVGAVFLGYVAVLMASHLAGFWFGARRAHERGRS